jgi:chemotaxis protein MotB
MVLGTLALMLMGCVSQRRADELETLYRRSQEQVIDLRAQLEEAQSRIKALQSAQTAQDPATLAKLEQAMAERDRLAKALSEAEDSLRKAGQTSVALPEDLNQALISLAQSNPNLIEYDSRLGMLRFRSDLTFPSGSAEVSTDAKGSLDKLAGILKSPSAAKYEARVVGHTDNVPINRPATKAKYPDNWYLSAARAIAVMKILQSDGVPPVRMMVAGHGEYRPEVPQGSHGAEANRRVEIYLVPFTYNGPTGSAAASPAKQASPASAAPSSTQTGEIEEGPAPTAEPSQFK